MFPFYWSFSTELESRVRPQRMQTGDPLGQLESSLEMEARLLRAIQCQDGLTGGWIHMPSRGLQGIGAAI